MGRQTAENLRRDKYQKDIPEDRGENLHTDLSKERERGGGEEKSKSRDLSNRSLNRWGDGKQIT